MPVPLPVIAPRPRAVIKPVAQVAGPFASPEPEIIPTGVPEDGRLAMAALLDPLAPRMSLRLSY